jgi:hypothetical protein
MNEGERNALLSQVTMHINATEKKLRTIGLVHVKVGLFDERTRQPISDPQELLDMAEGKEPPEVIARRKDAESDRNKADEYAGRLEKERDLEATES